MLSLFFVVFPTDNSLSSAIYAFLALFLPILLLWRLWKFSLVAILWPQEPKEIPYWVPGEVDSELMGRLRNAFVLTGFYLSSGYHSLNPHFRHTQHQV